LLALLESVRGAAGSGFGRLGGWPLGLPGLRLRVRRLRHCAVALCEETQGAAWIVFRWVGLQGFSLLGCVILTEGQSSWAVLLAKEGYYGIYIDRQRRTTRILACKACVEAFACRP